MELRHKDTGTRGTMGTGHPTSAARASAGDGAMQPRRELPSDEQVHEALRRYFGYPTFRPGQQEVIAAVLAGEDVLVVMPTGSGKSLCYQLPAVLLPGMAVVISPLIALMEDQVQGLQQRGIPATCLHSGLPEGVLQERLQGCVAGAYKLLYVAPERLQQASFLQRLRACSLSFVAVDEAHCISEWGHEFRPAYLLIEPAVRQLGRPALVALTATATPEVQQDIIEQLRLRSLRVFVHGFDRPNLFWAVEQGAGKRKFVVEFCARRRGQSVLVYAASRRRVEQVCQWLREHGLPAGAYHAGLNPEVRQRTQEEFLSGRLPLLVATSAFGLGIDKPDIRAVVHYDPPLTLEAYYQEAGRAGRDGEPAECALLYDPDDCGVQHQLLAAAHPDWATVQQVYRAVRELARGQSSLAMTAIELANRLRLPQPTVEAVLRLLERVGLVQEAVPDGELMLQLTASREELYEYWQQSTVPERRRVVEALLRSVGAEAWREYVPVSVAELARRQGLTLEELQRGLRALLYAGLIRCHGFQLQAGIALRQPLPEELPVSAEELERRRQYAWRKFERVLQYATTTLCKRLFLLHYFRDMSRREPCGHCSSCAHPQRAPLRLPFRVPRVFSARRQRDDSRRQAVVALAQGGASLKAICQATGLAPATVARLLQEALEQGVELPRDSLVPDERLYRAVCLAVQRLGEVPLRDIAAAVGGVGDYPLLRLAVAFARRQLATSGRSSGG